MVAAALAIAVIAWMAGRAGAPSSPEAQPLPGPTDRLDLKGLFVGESAAADAATTAALLGELADVVEWDGKQQAPRLSTGSAIHDLRTASREIRCRGQKIGDRQPAARDKIKAYLDSSAGTEGGPLSPDARSRWVAAYREVSRAASDAIGVSPLSETPAGAVGDMLILAAVAIAAWFAFLAWGRNP